MTPRATEPSPRDRAIIEKRFVWTAAALAVFLAAVPAIYAKIAAPAGSSYLGFEVNTDDHMVYSAWMHQAMNGHFFFDNRFTTEAQPGLTVHLYFWVLGVLARFVGIPLASNLSRLFFTGLFVPLLYRLVKRVTETVFSTRLAIALTVFGGGVGFLVWDNFGRAIEPAKGGVFAPMLGLLPVDVWQPEAFVFPSMLTNGLFMVSLCLILVAFLAFLEAETSWKPVLGGAIAIGLLMNIHSYDVLTIGFVMAGFLVTQVVERRLSTAWLLRAVVITAGVVPAALWFVHVLRTDPVFQSRAATPTYSPNFRQVFFGYLLMFLLALPGLFALLKTARQRVGLGLFVALLLGLFAAGTGSPDGYFLTATSWIPVAVLGLICLGLMASGRASLDLLLSWAVMGLIAIYFPALFQRKLAMGLSIPWAILATVGFAEFVKSRDRSSRNLATVLVILVTGASSICWIARRDLYLIRNNVSNTTVEPVFLNHDEQMILRDLHARKGRFVVVAVPGVPTPEFDSDGNRIPDAFATPTIPDMNTLCSGLTGAYTYAGHWSETPDYEAKRREVGELFSARTPDDERLALLDKIKPDFIIEPSPEAFGSAFAELAGLGETVYSGGEFKLIRVQR